MSDRMVSAQLCFAVSSVYGAIGTLEQDHRSIKNGWDSKESQALGEELESMAVRLTELADVAVAYP